MPEGDHAAAGTGCKQIRIQPLSSPISLRNVRDQELRMGAKLCCLPKREWAARDDHVHAT